MNEQIAADARPLIEAFRASGARSFEQLGVEAARRGYVASSAANGLAPVEMASVRDLGASGVPLRVYVPQVGAAAEAAILFLHGGGWVIGNLETHDGLCRTLAADSGCPVVAVDYRLAPEHPFPAALEDARSALHALVGGSVGDLGVPRRIAIVGDSAGGGLAAILSVQYAAESDSRRPVLAAQGLLYPVTDLTMSTPSYQRLTTGFALTAETMRWFSGLYVPADVDRRHAELSPLRATQPESPAPAFVCTVGLDPLADEGILYAAALAQAGAHVEHIHLPHHAHGLFTSAGRIETGRAVLTRLTGFLQERLG